MVSSLLVSKVFDVSELAKFFRVQCSYYVYCYYAINETNTVL